MKIFFLFLILASFMQAAFLPINLVLILLICRSFVFDSHENYLLALSTGAFLGLLTSVNLGFWALIFLIIVKLTHTLKKLPISTNIFTIIPASFLLILLASFIDSFIHQTTINYFLIFIESLLALPIYIAVKLWEERFVVHTGIKLKV